MTFCLFFQPTRFPVIPIDNMKLRVLSGALFLVLYLSLTPAISAQVASAAGKTAVVSGKIVLVVVGTSAKIAWKTTEFTAKEIAWPVTKATLKPMATKVAPKVSIFLLKESG